MGISVKDYLEGQINGKLGEASAIAEMAERSARDMTAIEKEECRKLLDEVGRLKSQVQEIEDREELKQKIDSIRGPAVTSIEESAEGLTIGEAFAKSEGFKAVTEAGFTGKWTTGAIEVPDFLGAKAIRSGSKATVTEAVSGIVTPDYRPGIQSLPIWPVRITDLIPEGTTNSNSLVYVEELAETNAAAATAEGDAKPESALTFHTVTEPVQKVATFLPVSDEMLEDVDQIQSYLNGRLGLFVQKAEESNLLSGNGSAPNISGITNRSIQTSTALALDADSAFDAVYRAMTAVTVTGGLDPDAIVMHPIDWASFKLTKDLNDQYYGGGPLMGQYGAGGFVPGNSMWGLPVVTTTAIASGTVLVGAFRQGAQIFRRRGLTVEASNSHSDFFQRNLTAIRAETRLGLAVYRPKAFYKITSLSGLLSGS